MGGSPCVLRDCLSRAPAGVWCERWGQARPARGCGGVWGLAAAVGLSWHRLGWKSFCLAVQGGEQCLHDEINQMFLVETT